MGKLFPEVTSELADFIAEQKLFFVATAPERHDHHINISPKGHNTFTLASPRAAYYVDLTGSGNETISHLTAKSASRNITIMFVAFEGPPNIVRLWGKGKVILIDEKDDFNRLVPEGDERRLPGARAIIWIDIHAVGTSCGYSIPYFDYRDERPTLLDFFKVKIKNDEKGKDKEGVRAYWALKNSVSIDDLAGPGQTIGVNYPGQAFHKRIADVSTLKQTAPPKRNDGLLPGILFGILIASVYFAIVRPLIESVGALSLAF